jgi:hypothetical protein
MVPIHEMIADSDAAVKIEGPGAPAALPVRGLRHGEAPGDQMAFRAS